MLRTLIASIQINVYEIADLRSRQLKQFLPVHCPIMVTHSAIADKLYYNLTKDYEIFIRKHLMPAQRYHRSILVWVGNDSIPDVLDVFANTIMRCSQVQELGVYHLVCYRIS